MSNEQWGAAPAARGAARPAVLCAALGIAASALTFFGAVTLGRGLAGGSALAALLVPLALSGALAVGLTVAFVVQTVLTQPNGPRRVRRAVALVTPFAALVAVVVYAADPSVQVGRPTAGGAVPDVIERTPYVPPRTRTVVVPPAPPTRPVTPPVDRTPGGGDAPPANPTGPGPGGRPADPGTPNGPGVGPVAPRPVGPVVGPVAPPVAGPAAPPAPAPEPEPDPREVPPRGEIGPEGPGGTPPTYQPPPTTKPKATKKNVGKPRRGCPPAPKAKAHGCVTKPKPKK